MSDKRPSEPGVRNYVPLAPPSARNGPRRTPESLEALMGEVIERVNTIGERVSEIGVRLDRHAGILMKVYDDQIADRRLTTSKLDAITGLLERILCYLPRAATEPPPPVNDTVLEKAVSEPRIPLTPHPWNDGEL